MQVRAVMKRPRRARLNLEAEASGVANLLGRGGGTVRRPTIKESVVQIRREL